MHSPAEYARYLSRSEPPSSFPLFAHIGQFWQGYAAVNREVARFPFNGGYHLMVMVIGSSTTVEYGCKGIYEHTIGRLAEATVSGDAAVPEERLYADYAQAYVDFIRLEPWYKFDFLAPLKQLWAELPLSGANLIRRWERRFALTTELLVKEGYARLIKLGTQSVYDAPKPTTAVVLDKSPEPDIAAFPDYAARPTSGPEVAGDDPALRALHRLQPLARRPGHRLPRDRRQRRRDPRQPARRRAAGRARRRRARCSSSRSSPARDRSASCIAIRVAQLAALLRSFGEKRGGVVVEHIYDF